MSTAWSWRALRSRRSSDILRWWRLSRCRYRQTVHESGRRGKVRAPRSSQTFSAKGNTTKSWPKFDAARSSSQGWIRTHLQLADPEVTKFVRWAGSCEAQLGGGEGRRWRSTNVPTCRSAILDSVCAGSATALLGALWLATKGGPIGLELTGHDAPTAVKMCPAQSACERWWSRPAGGFVGDTTPKARLADDLGSGPARPWPHR
jgi:hypothetical protein